RARSAASRIPTAPPTSSALIARRPQPAGGRSTTMATAGTSAPNDAPTKLNTNPTRKSRSRPARHKTSRLQLRIDAMLRTARHDGLLHDRPHRTGRSTGWSGPAVRLVVDAVAVRVVVLVALAAGQDVPDPDAFALAGRGGRTVGRRRSRTGLDPVGRPSWDRP